MPARPDLGRAALFVVLAVSGAAVALAAVLGMRGSPSSPPGQAAGIAAALLLLLPVAFSVSKRAGLAHSPPAWFVVHVLASAAACVLAAGHAAGGDLLSPPALLLLALAFLVVQGTLARAQLSAPLAARFAAGASAFGAPDPARRAAIQDVIATKRRLLASIDTAADEALFSPALRHWLRHPRACARYQRLAAREADLIGARRRAGALLARWRMLHMLVAWVLVLGVLVHVVTVLFFAGYVAEGRPIDWWHITDWG
jgi:hypothetical protein